MKGRGFTLLDLLVTISIGAIITGIGIPSLATFVDKSRADNAAQAIYRGLQFGRVTAVTTQQTLTVCGSNDGKTCLREWGNYLLIFADENDNKICETGELIRQENLGFGDSRITTRVGWGRPYTRMKPDGSVSFQGSIVYCSAGNPSSVRRVTWNMLGRPYFGRDSDGDGIVNHRGGEKVKC